MRLLEGYSTLYTSLSIRVGRIGAKLVCLGVTSKQARVAPECCHGVQRWKWRCSLTGLRQETDMLLDDDHIADAQTYCHVFLDCIRSRRKLVWGLGNNGQE